MSKNWKLIADAPDDLRPIICGFVNNHGQIVPFVAYATGPETRTPGFAEPTHWCDVPKWDGE